MIFVAQAETHRNDVTCAKPSRTSYIPAVATTRTWHNLRTKKHVVFRQILKTKDLSSMFLRTVVFCQLLNYFKS